MVEDIIEIPKSINGMKTHPMSPAYQVVLDEDCSLEVEDIDCGNIGMKMKDVEMAGLIIVTDNYNYKIVKNRYFKTGILTIDDELSGNAVFYILKAFIVGVVIGMGSIALFITI
jgi:hypothetical protein